MSARPPSPAVACPLCGAPPRPSSPGYVGRHGTPEKRCPASGNPLALVPDRDEVARLLAARRLGLHLPSGAWVRLDAGASSRVLVAAAVERNEDLVDWREPLRVVDGQSRKLSVPGLLS